MIYGLNITFECLQLFNIYTATFSNETSMQLHSKMRNTGPTFSDIHTPKQPILAN